MVVCSGSYLDNVNPADAVLLANLVKRLEQLKAVGIDLRPNGDLDGQSLLEDYGEVDMLVRGRLSIDRASPHVLWGWKRRVFQDSRLVRAAAAVRVEVQVDSLLSNVVVHRERLSG